LTIKHRLEKIEEQLVPPSVSKLWIIPGDIEDQTVFIDSIKAGKVQHESGNFYKDSDKFLIINRVFTDSLPSKITAKSSNEAIAEKVRILKEKKEKLEREIKEGKK